jgi:uncharacterized membrane protein YcaP (DUF421 family)
MVRSAASFFLLGERLLVDGLVSTRPGGRIRTEREAAPQTGLVYQRNIMWIISLPWWEFILRGVIVYFFLIVLLRLTGKRQIGQMAPFDLVLLLVLSNAVQNAMNGGDNSVTAGVVSAVTLVGVNWLVGLVTYKSKAMETLVEGRPEILIHNGQLFEQALKHTKITHHELMSALRAAGCATAEDVHSAMLETDGSISVIPKK